MSWELAIWEMMKAWNATSLVHLGLTKKTWSFSEKLVSFRFRRLVLGVGK